MGQGSGKTEAAMISAIDTFPPPPGLLGSWSPPIEVNDLFFVLEAALLIGGWFFSSRRPRTAAACYVGVPFPLVFNHVYAHSDDGQVAAFAFPLGHLQAVGQIGFAVTLVGAAVMLRSGRADLLAVVPAAILSYHAVIRFSYDRLFIVGGYLDVGVPIIAASVAIAGAAAFFLIAGALQLAPQESRGSG